MQVNLLAGGVKVMAAHAVASLPAWLWSRLPARAALALRSFSRRHGDARLPVVAVGELAPSVLPRRWASPSPKAEMLRAYSGYVGSGTGTPVKGRVHATASPGPVHGGGAQDVGQAGTGSMAVVVEAVTPIAHARPD